MAGHLKAAPVVRIFQSKSDVGVVQSSEEAVFESWKSLMAIDNSSRESLLRAISMTPLQAILSTYGTSLDGLTEDEAAERLSVAGPNRLDSKKAMPWWLLLLSVLPNPFNILLVLIAIISVATPPPSWATFVLLIVMIVLSVGVRFHQEWKGTTEAIKLQSSVVTEIQVRRRSLDMASGITKEIDLGLLVPGDVITLSPGDNVPADCMIVHTKYLQVSQSSLTGESEPVGKQMRALEEKNELEAIFDVPNLAFMGTVVVSGSATALVLGTGNNTLIASVTKELNKKRPASAFEIGIRRVSYVMITMMLVMVSVVLVIQGELSHNWSSASLFALSVAVGIVPEMLPAIINVSLARGAFLLSKKRAIVRRLDAVQNLGGMSVLCSDKTGTLTKDEISLSRAENTLGAEDAHVLRLAYTNATYQSGKKNSIDSAIIRQRESSEKVEPLGECVAEMPFNFEKRRCSTVIRRTDGVLEFICKGAFEEVLSLCNRMRVGDTVVRLTESDSQRLCKRAIAFNEDGLRVLAICTKELNHLDVDDPDWIAMAESSVILEGLLTFLDPPKEDAAAAIASLRDQGVEVKVLTGDSLRIAAKVCRTLNLTGPDIESGIQSISGPDLAKLDHDEFDETVKRCTIFAKLTPSQKGEVVQSLKRSGKAVGMLGDGINDCLALRLADVGISVNTGTNVAKDCADVILTQKELSIIVDGIKVGRLTHGNSI
jgi:Mg2+-importing ATPase